MRLFSDHLRGLLTFSGRERRQPFWLWILVCYVGQMIVSTLISMPLTASFSSRFEELTQRGQEYLDQHPEVLMQVMSQTMAPLMQAMMAVGVILALLFTVLSAAAIVRRLHDSGRSGWWTAPYFAMQVVTPILYASIFPNLFDAFARIAPGTSPDQLDAVLAPIFQQFMMLAAIGVVGFIIMIVLIVLLCQPSTVGANRFGAEPEPV